MSMNAGTGRSLTGSDHIRQSISDILATPLGSRVMRRDYGSLLPDLIDQPMNNANLLRMYSAAVVAVAQWEPRVKITRVTRRITPAGQSVLEMEASKFNDGSRAAFEIPMGVRNA